MKVKLEKYDSNWKLLFEIEKSKLLNVLNSKIEIEHIGSTSIYDIDSKPVIDIMIGVEEEKQLDENIENNIPWIYLCAEI